MKCIYCNSEKLYKLKTDQLKCAKCKKKFSPVKIYRENRIIELFSKGVNAFECAKQIGSNYITVKKRYDTYRKYISQYLEDSYKNREILEYDEYIYLAKSKKKISENIFDAQNFLTFHYENKVYNILLPSLKRYKREFLESGANEAYFKELSKSMVLNKISKIQKRENLITKFWLFFEKEIVKYKGFKDENFFYYLKECEFRFNYSYKERVDILKPKFCNRNLG